jgi:uncharacterized membrane protein
MKQQGTQQTLNIDYDSSIETIYAEAWKKTAGFKTTFWKACISIALIIVISSALIRPLSGIITTNNDITTNIINQFLTLAVNIFLITPLFAGLLMLMIKHCTGVASPIGTLFQYFRYWKRLWVYPVAIWILGWIEIFFTGHVLTQLAIGFIALLVGVLFFMYIPLVLEKNISTTTALLMSIHAIFQNFSQVFGFLLAIIIILFATSFTFGLGLVWTLPWIGNAIAIFYRELFGIQITLV